MRRGCDSGRFGITTCSTPVKPEAVMPSGSALSGSAKRRWKGRGCAFVYAMKPFGHAIQADALRPLLRVFHGAQPSLYVRNAALLRKRPSGVHRTSLTASSSTEDAARSGGRPA
jgi:hypothetical protein